MQNQHAEHEFKLSEGNAIDPVCGMTVVIATAKHQLQLHGHPYYFCGAGCKTKFQTNPTKYLDTSTKSTEPVVAGAIYTCPMHPEVQQVGPGTCPICGMALEPTEVAPFV